MFSVVYNGGFAPLDPRVVAKFCGYLQKTNIGPNSPKKTLVAPNLEVVLAILKEIAAKNISVADVSLTINGEAAIIEEDGTCNVVSALLKTA